MVELDARTDDGTRLALRRFPPTGARRGVLLCTHAMMASGRYFHAGRGGFARHLAGAGVDTFVLDWRGHGASRPPTPGRDSWGFDDYVTRDAPAALAAVCRAAGVTPDQVVYGGHSLGGLVGLAALGTGAMPAPRALLLWACSVWLPGRKGSPARRTIMRLYRASARLTGRAPIRALRLGSDDEPRGYVEELARWALSGRWTGPGGVDYLARLAAIRTPAWAIVGDGDRLCHPADAAVLAARVPSARPMRRVGRAHGDAFDPDHFTLFTDDRLAPLWDEVASFVSFR